jgi:hypothetical protein
MIDTQIEGFVPVESIQTLVENLRTVAANGETDDTEYGRGIYRGLKIAADFIERNYT